MQFLNPQSVSARDREKKVHKPLLPFTFNEVCFEVYHIDFLTFPLFASLGHCFHLSLCFWHLSHLAAQIKLRRLQNEREKMHFLLCIFSPNATRRKWRKMYLLALAFKIRALRSSHCFCRKPFFVRGYYINCFESVLFSRMQYEDHQC